MAQNETWLTHDLMNPVKVQYLAGNLFSMDNAGNLIGVTITKDGVAYSGGGSVSANVIRADGGTVAVSGALSGNVATVVLPAAAYFVPGVTSIVVKLTVNSEITTVAAVVVNVYESSTDTAIDPGTIMPSIQTLIDQINAVVASIPADYSSLWETLAPTFSNSTAYTVGQYVTYDGGMYRFIANHAAGAWSSSDVTSVVVGNEIANLNSEIAQKQDAPSVAGTAGQFLGLDSNLDPAWMDVPQIDDSTVSEDSLWSSEKIFDELQDKANVIVNTASGAIASFSDGADGMLVKKMSVDIDPVQDLHGYDNPWPAGGGKNIIPMTLAQIKSKNTIGTWNNNDYSIGGITYSVLTDSDGNVTGLNVNGTASGNASLFFTIANTETIPISSGSYVLSGCPASGSTTKYYLQCFGTNEYNTGSGILDTGSGATATFTADDSVKNFMFQVRSGNTVNNLKLYPMFRKSSESSDFAPYENNCPISGWDSANVSRTGKNLFNIATSSTKKFINANGGVSNSDNWSASDYISVKAEQTYTLSGVTNTGSTARHAFYDKDKNFLSAISVLNNNTFTVPSNAFYVRLSLKDENPTNVQFEIGSTASAFESYHGSTTQYEFPEAAGTVYGGTLTIHQDGSGELVVDYAKQILTGAMFTGDNISGNNHRIYANISDMASYTGLNDPNSKCNVLEKGETLNQSLPLSVTIGANNKYVYINGFDKIGISTFSAAKDWVDANNVEVTYKLATPITYPLTPGQVKTMLGVNNVWADCGNVSLEYPADTKLYIDGKMAEIQALILENISNS